MLAAVADASPAPLDGRDVIITIIGGTMLTVALTRPRLRWIEHVTEGSERRRIWAERSLTGLSFVMIGYAGTSVWMQLYGVGREVDELLTGAAAFLAIYAAIVHFEPFVSEWRLYTGFDTWLFYLSFASVCTVIGGALWEAVLTSSVDLTFVGAILAGVLLTALTWREAHCPPPPPQVRPRRQR